MKKSLFVLVLLCTFLSANSKFNVEKQISVQGIIWGMEFISDDKMIFTIRDGKIYLFDLKNKRLKKLLNVKVRDVGQGGLLDVKKSPNFSKDKTLYFTYVKYMNGYGATTLATAIYDNNELKNFKDLFITDSVTNRNYHFGSRITFDEEGHLFFSIGDRGIRKNAQNLTNHAGSILRLNLDGTVPKDNPFIGKKRVLPEIYSYGHRNSQGLFYDKDTKKLWSIEHGPRGGDEINLIEKGLNYGWPIISYGKEYMTPKPVGIGTHKEGMEQPKKVYIPSIAPSSIIVYKGNLFKEFKGSLLSGALKLTHINKVDINSNGNLVNEKRYLENMHERIRDIIESKSGELYISTDSGNIYKIWKN